MRMMSLLMLTLVLAQLQTGCVDRNGTETVRAVTTVIDTACKWVHPIMVGNSDELTEETARQIEVHNEAWEVNCGEGTGSDSQNGR